MFGNQRRLLSHLFIPFLLCLKKEEWRKNVLYCLGDIADIPLVLLQNVAKFCRTGGLLAMTNILNLPPAVLPHSFAHGLGIIFLIGF